MLEPPVAADKAGNSQTDRAQWRDQTSSVCCWSRQISRVHCQRHRQTTIALGHSWCCCILCDCKCSAITAQLTITKLSYGTNTPQKCPFAWVSQTLSNTWFLAPLPTQPPKRHLDQFSRLCSAHKRDQHTQIHTDRPSYSVSSNRQLSLDVMHHKNKDILEWTDIKRQSATIYGKELMAVWT